MYGVRLLRLRAGPIWNVLYVRGVAIPIALVLLMFHWLFLLLDADRRSALIQRPTRQLLETVAVYYMYGGLVHGLNLVWHPCMLHVTRNVARCMSICTDLRPIETTRAPLTSISIKNGYIINYCLRVQLFQFILWHYWKPCVYVDSWKSG